MRPDHVLPPLLPLTQSPTANVRWLMVLVVQAGDGRQVLVLVR
jgi:hypothetical protein